MASDTPDQNLLQYFPVCNDFIHAARIRDGIVLIHCLAGMSRSVTVAVAYIMSVTNLSWKESLKVVRTGRSVANPNLGFRNQLQEFEMFKLAEVNVQPIKSGVTKLFRTTTILDKKFFSSCMICGLSRINDNNRKNKKIWVAKRKFIIF